MLASQPAGHVAAVVACLARLSVAPSRSAWPCRKEPGGAGASAGEEDAEGAGVDAFGGGARRERSLGRRRLRREREPHRASRERCRAPELRKFGDKGRGFLLDVCVLFFSCFCWCALYFYFFNQMVRWVHAWVDFLFYFFFLFLFCLFIIFSVKQPQEHACIYSFFLLVAKHHVRNILKPCHILSTISMHKLNI